MPGELDFERLERPRRKASVAEEEVLVAIPATREGDCRVVQDKPTVESRTILQVPIWKLAA